MNVLNELTNDYDKADALVNVLIDHATGSRPSEDDFNLLRRYFVEHPDWSQYLPSWFASKRSLNQFWNFIRRFPTYAERNKYLWDEFNSLLSRLETGTVTPAENVIEDGLQAFNSDEVNRAWLRMVRRINEDTEGAITASRNLLETVLKHILDEREIFYDNEKIELSDLFKKVQVELEIAPEQHQEKIFKQILGGCSGVVNGLGSLRNKLGDAHGCGVRSVRPAQRHAKLAVNLAGSMALFLTETHIAKNT